MGRMVPTRFGADHRTVRVSVLHFAFWTVGLPFLRALFSFVKTISFLAFADCSFRPPSIIGYDNFIRYSWLNAIECVSDLTSKLITDLQVRNKYCTAVDEVSFGVVELPTEIATVCRSVTVTIVCFLSSEINVQAIVVPLMDILYHKTASSSSAFGCNC